MQRSSTRHKQNFNRQQTGVQVCAIRLDLSSQAFVRAGAKENLRQGVQIDVVINNAGSMALPERKLSEDGIEMQFATNFLEHFLLTSLLKPALADDTRIVNLTSSAYRSSAIRFHDVNFDKKTK